MADFKVYGIKILRIRKWIHERKVANASIRRKGKQSTGDGSLSDDRKRVQLHQVVHNLVNVIIASSSSFLSVVNEPIQLAPWWKRKLQARHSRAQWKGIRKNWKRETGSLEKSPHDWKAHINIPVTERDKNCDSYWEQDRHLDLRSLGKLPGKDQ